LLDGPNFCVISVLAGEVVRSYIMWIGVREERLIVVSPSGSPKTEAMISARHVTVLIWRDGHAYDYVEAQCAVTRTESGDRARTLVEQTLAIKYRGRPYPRPDIAEWTMVELVPLRQRTW
jgi:hypothetical protein